MCNRSTSQGGCGDAGGDSSGGACDLLDPFKFHCKRLLMIDTCLEVRWGLSMRGVLPIA